MRKYLILAMAICIVSCGKPEPQAEQVPADNELVGTKWMTTGLNSIMSLLQGGTWYEWFEFTSNTTLDCYWTDADNHVIESDGELTYTFSYPELFVTDSEGETDKYLFQDKRSFTFVKDDGELNTRIVFYKQ